MQILEFPTLELATLPQEDEGEMEGQTNKERFAGIEYRLGEIETALELNSNRPSIFDNDGSSHEGVLL